MQVSISLKTHHVFIETADFKDFQRDIDSVIAGECFLTLRSRLLCKIYAQTHTNAGEYRCTNGTPNA